MLRAVRNSGIALRITMVAMQKMRHFNAKEAVLFANDKGDKSLVDFMSVRRRIRLENMKSIYTRRAN